LTLLRSVPPAAPLLMLLMMKNTTPQSIPDHPLVIS
jgi:hypothetical protein